MGPIPTQKMLSTRRCVTEIIDDIFPVLKKGAGAPLSIMPSARVDNKLTVLKKTQKEAAGAEMGLLFFF